MAPTGEVYFVDVGHGHATLVLAGGRSMLIDCPYSGAPAVNSLLDDHEADQLDAAVITHRDLDHCGGFPEILRRHPAQKLYFNPAYSAPAPSARTSRVRAVLKDILSAAEESGTTIDFLARGDSGEIDSVSWRALGPTPAMMHSATLDNLTNRASIVLRLELGERRFLLTGDIDSVAVADLLQSGEELDADVLLSPHHGAAISNLDQLVDAVKPNYAVVSVARSSSVHPAVQTLQTLASRRRCRILCTQVNRTCHPFDLASPGCAGTIRFAVGAHRLAISPTVAAHGDRIDVFESPVCRLAAPDSARRR